MPNSCLQPQHVDNIARVVKSSFEDGNDASMARQIQNFTLILGQNVPEYDSIKIYAAEASMYDQFYRRLTDSSNDYQNQLFTVLTAFELKGVLLSQNFDLVKCVSYALDENADKLLDGIPEHKIAIFKRKYLQAKTQLRRMRFN